MIMDFCNSLIDIVVCASFPKKIIKAQVVQDESLNTSGDNFSDVSSVRSDQRVDIKVNKRQLQNDKEYLKYVRIQMWWNFIARLLLGIYELILAFVIIYAHELDKIRFINFSFECRDNSWNHNLDIIIPQKMGWGFLTMQNVLICLSVKFSCIVFYTIPFKYNRIKKSQKELEHQKKAISEKKSQKREKIKKSAAYKLS